MMQAWMAAALVLAADPGADETAGVKSGLDAGAIEVLIDDLADDHIRWNCETAMERLAEAGLEAVPALEAALASQDRQQRQCAAHVLRRIEGYEPSGLMLAVCVEGLEDDGLPYDVDSGWEGRYTYVFNASEGTRYLAAHARQAEPLLVAGVKDGKDEQTRFLSAVALAWSGAGRHGPAAAGVLIPHLCENDVPGDASLAGASLVRLGEGVLPLLRMAQERSEDEQQGKWLERVIGRLEGWEAGDARACPLWDRLEQFSIGLRGWR